MKDENKNLNSLVSYLETWNKCIKEINYDIDYINLIKDYQKPNILSSKTKEKIRSIKIFESEISLVNNRYYHSRLSPKVLLLISKLPYFGLEYNLLGKSSADGLKFLVHNYLFSDIIELGTIGLSSNYEGFEFTSMIYSNDIITLYLKIIKLKITSSDTICKLEPNDLYITKKCGTKIEGYFYLLRELYFEQETGLVLRLYFVHTKENLTEFEKCL